MHSRPSAWGMLTDITPKGVLATYESELGACSRKREANSMPLLNLSGICSHQIAGATFDYFYCKYNERILNYLKGSILLWHLKHVFLSMENPSIIY